MVDTINSKFISVKSTGSSPVRGIMIEYLIILFLPLFSFIYCITYGRCVPFHVNLNNFARLEGIKLTSVIASFITCLTSFYVFYQVGFLKNPYYLILGT